MRGEVTRALLYGLLLTAVCGVVWMHGYFRGERNLWEYQAKQAKAAVPVVVKQGEITVKTVTVYRDRIVKVKAETAVLTKEITVYVPPSADPVLGIGWVRLHDTAATRAVPEAAPGADVTAPAIAASQALKGVIENYGQYYECAVQLITLQEWVRYQFETMNQEPLGF